MNVFIITLVDREDRLKNAEELASLFKQQGFNPMLLPATRFDGREFSEIAYSASEGLDQRMTAGEIACAWSHYRACRAVFESGEGAFVFEDDARLLRDLTQVRVGGISHILSGSNYPPSQQFRITSTNQDRSYHHTVGLPYGTQGYYLTVEGAKVLIDNLLPIRWASDIALDRLSKAGILKTQLAIEPWAIQNGDIPSHIGLR